MFESLNEEGGWEELWNRYSNEGDKEKSYSILNEINQKFVDIVRASGKNNGKRHLLIAGYNTCLLYTSTGNGDSSALCAVAWIRHMEQGACCCAYNILPDNHIGTRRT